MSTAIGFVYFIEAAESEAIKIGFTYSPLQRLQKMLYWSPCALRIAATAPGRIKDERAIHRAFASSRMHHEWFRRTPALTAMIDEVAKTGVLPAQAAA